MSSSRYSLLAAAVGVLVFARLAAGQLTITGLAPAATTAGMPSFALTVSGSGFAVDATVSFDGNTLSATGTATQLTATVPASLIATARTVNVFVTNPGTPPVNSNTVSFTVNPALGIVTATVPSPWTQGAVYPSTTLAASGGTGAPTWALAPGSGPLPGGLTLSSGGVLSGTPTAPGSFSFTVRATDTVGAIADNPFNITINPPPAITGPSSLPSPWTQGATYPPATMTGTGGTGAYTWSASGLPPGLVIGTATGTILGTATTSAGSPFNVTVTLTDTVGATANRSYSVIINPPPSITGPASLPPGTVGTSYPPTQMTASGGTGAYTWSATGLPSGLAIDPATGIISGTPTSSTGSPFSVTVTVRDSTLLASASQVYALTITSPTPTITTLSPNAAVAGGGDFPLTVSGTNFVTGAVVNWNAVPLATAFVSATQLTATVPAANIATAGTAAVAVANPGPVTSAPATFTIIPVLAVTTTALPSGSTGAAYSANLAASGGTMPYTWSISMGALPPGLTLDSPTGRISGTPTATGNYAFTVQVTDGGTPPLRQTASTPLAINVASGLTVATSALPAASVSVAYSRTLTAAGGIAPYSWALAGGSLPPGLSLGTNGLISGVPTASGTFSFTVQVTDAAAGAATKALSITVTAALTIRTSSPLPDGIVGRSYSALLAASGGSPPYPNWLVVSGALPPGLSLNSQTGFLSGTPAAAGVFSFTVQVTDSASAAATKYFTLTVSSSVSITTTSLPGGSTGASYSQALAASGGTPPYSWTITLGSLPPGLTLTPGTGVLSGVPTTAGSYPVTIRVTDSASTPGSAVREFVVVISEGLTITSPSQLPSGSTGVSYSTALTAAGGRAPYTWLVASGNLPPGLTLGASTGILSGTPTTAGSYSFVLQVTDSTPTSATKAVSLVIAAGLTITTSSQLPAGVTGVAYSQTLTATGGTEPYSWAVIQGQLPGGLSLSTGGIVAGTPTVIGSFNFTVQVTDKLGNNATKQLAVEVAGGLTITTEATLPAATVGVSYSQTLTAAGGAAPYSDWRVTSGILPAGLTLDAGSGRISGAPTTAGTLKFTIQVKDATGRTGSKEFTLTVQVAALTITTAPALPPGIAGQAYSQSLQASGGVPPYTWTVAAGALPAGLSLTASTGQISGTPTGVVAASFTVEVTDSARRTASKAFTLAIDPPPLPAVQITGPPDTLEPAQQPGVRLSLASGYPVAITGQLTLTFEPDAVHPRDDPAVVFSNGTRTASFSIAANATQAALPAGFAIQTGTVAGTITLRATFQAGGRDITPTPAPVKVSRLLRAAPVIRSVQVERTSAGFDVVIKGFSSPRQVTQASFRFTPAAGANLQTTELTVPLTALADQWFLGQESAQYGSQFTLRQPFTVQGDSRAISAVSVTLANSVGASPAASAGF